MTNERREFFAIFYFFYFFLLKIHIDNGSVDIVFDIRLKIDVGVVCDFFFELQFFLVIVSLIIEYFNGKPFGLQIFV